jgi:hypothetical protein
VAARTQLRVRQRDRHVVLADAAGAVFVLVAAIPPTRPSTAAPVNRAPLSIPKIPLTPAARSAVHPVACVERPAQPDRAALVALRVDGCPCVVVAVAAWPQLGVRQGDARETRWIARPVVS